MVAMRRLVVVGTCAALALVAGCARQGDAGPDVIVSPTEERFPFSTLSEARSFADQWVVATVDQEVVGKVQGEGPPDEGYVPRSVTISIHGVASEGPPGAVRGDTVELDVLGYALHDGVRVPLVSEGGQRLGVGETYLFGLAVDEGDVILPSARAAFLIDDGQVSVERRFGERDDLADHLAGRPITEAVELVQDATPAVSPDISSLSARLDAHLAET